MGVLHASLHFILLIAFQTLWEAFQAKNNERSAPASTAPVQVSHLSHDVHTANHHLRALVEL